jgi:phospholipid methyltransferase
MSDSPKGRLVAALARARVPLGFGFAIAVLLMARPTPRTLAGGFLVALCGEAFRVWAAGHLEKGREVTRSGPYRWTRHPLYMGSFVIGAGLAIASARASVAMLIVGYLAATIIAAIRHEETQMRARFGGEYDAYLRSGSEGSDRRFSWGRAMRNKEYRAMAGLAAAAAVLAIKAAYGSWNGLG